MKKITVNSKLWTSVSFWHTQMRAHTYPAFFLGPWIHSKCLQNFVRWKLKRLLSSLIMLQLVWATKDTLFRPTQTETLCLHAADEVVILRLNSKAYRCQWFQISQKCFFVVVVVAVSHFHLIKSVHSGSLQWVNQVLTFTLNNYSNTSHPWLHGLQ